MSITQSVSVTKQRALLTETEREQLAGEHEREWRYQATSRVRHRLKNELTADVDILEEHNTDLLKELREIVCPDTAEDEP